MVAMAVAAAPAARRSERDLFAEALAVQDACNLCGVAQSFARAMRDLLDIARGLGQGTDWANRHPVSVLWIDKMASLAEIQGDSFSCYAAAYEAARRATDGR